MRTSGYFFTEAIVNDGAQKKSQMLSHTIANVFRSSLNSLYIAKTGVN